MYQFLITLSFLGCIVWLYQQPGPEPVVALLASFAAFFRDDVHGVLGRNIVSLTAKRSLIRDIKNAKYSFINPEFVHPRILEDLIGWVSDSGFQIKAINVTDSNDSNRYYGEVTTQQDEPFPRVSSRYGDHGEWASYQYLGTSLSGMHILNVAYSGGGSGVWCYILLVTLSLEPVIAEEDPSFKEEGPSFKKEEHIVIKLVARVPLGDRYSGEVKYRLGVLTIPPCSGHQPLRRKTSRLFIL